MFKIAELLAATLTLLGAALNSRGLVVAKDDFEESSPDANFIFGPLITADALTKMKSISKS
jgi:hypothetical protein